MAKLTLEVDTENVNSVIGVYVMLQRLLNFWKTNLKGVDLTEGFKENDSSKIPTTTDENQPAPGN